MMDYKKNDAYFTRHFAELVKKYGGQWIVIVKGKRFEIGAKKDLDTMLDRVRTRYPDEAPLVTPIPTEEEIQCIL